MTGLRNLGDKEEVRGDLLPGDLSGTRDDSEEIRRPLVLEANIIGSANRERSNKMKTEEGGEKSKRYEEPTL